MRWFLNELREGDEVILEGSEFHMEFATELKDLSVAMDVLRAGGMTLFNDEDRRQREGV